MAHKELAVSQSRDNFSLTKGNIEFLGRLRIGLLQKIDQLGSLSQAARAVGISYKTAWNAITSMNQLSEQPLVITATGGKHGGGSQLTSVGKELVEVFGVLEKEHNRFVKALSVRIRDFESVYRLIGRISMKISARNQFFGTIRRVTRGSVNAEVELAIDRRTTIIATITNESVEELSLRKGVEAYALIKANLILLVSGQGDIRTSARNKLCGKISRIVPGAVNSEVAIEFARGKNVTAIITKESSRSMGLKVGSNACAIFKSSSVIIGIGG